MVFDVAGTAAVLAGCTDAFVADVKNRALLTMRAVLESVAYENAFYLRIMQELSPDLELFEARVVGGGARSPVWNQIKADVLGVPYQPLEGNEFGTWGSAIIAGKAAGVFDGLVGVACQHAHPAGEPLEPDVDTHTLYRLLVGQHIKWQAIFSDRFIELDNGVSS